MFFPRKGTATGFPTGAPAPPPVPAPPPLDEDFHDPALTPAEFRSRASCGVRAGQSEIKRDLCDVYFHVWSMMLLFGGVNHLAKRSRAGTHSGISPLCLRGLDDEAPG